MDIDINFHSFPLFQGSPKAVDIHDSTVSYLVALNETLAEGGDWRNGDLIQKKLRNRVVTGNANVTVEKKKPECDTRVSVQEINYSV